MNNFIIHIYKILLFKLWQHFERQEICFDQPKFYPQKPTMFKRVFKNLLRLIIHIPTYYV